MDENIQAAQVCLTEDDLQFIDAAEASAQIEGDRYYAAEMNNLNR